MAYFLFAAGRVAPDRSTQVQEPQLSLRDKALERGYSVNETIV